MTKTKMVSASLLAVLATVAGAAYAMGPWAGDWMGGRAGPGMLHHLVETLELSEQQEREIADIFHATRDSTLADRRAMRELEAQLREQRTGFDPDKARSIADEIGQITARTVYTMTSAQAEVYASLNENQRLALEDIMARRGPAGREPWRGK